MALILTADGWQESGVVAGNGCCPPPLCVDLCSLICSFISVLPEGPMWSYWKARAMDYYTQNRTAPCDPAPPEALILECPSLVQHAIYSAVKLYGMLNDALWVQYREGSPFTAQTTHQYWLDRYHWEDCFLSACRGKLLGDLTPYEVAGECGPVYCPPNFPDELKCALDKGLVTALARQQMGVIKNLAGLNWIIEPLGAAITVMTEAQRAARGIVDDPNSCCPNTAFLICNVGDTLPACLDPAACTPDTGEVVQSYFDWGVCYTDRPAGLPDRIYPGVLAAECIVRSLLWKTCPNNLYRCC